MSSRQPLQCEHEVTVQYVHDEISRRLYVTFCGQLRHVAFEDLDHLGVILQEESRWPWTVQAFVLKLAKELLEAEARA